MKLGSFSEKFEGLKHSLGKTEYDWVMSIGVLAESQAMIFFEKALCEISLKCLDSSVG